MDLTGSFGPEEEDPINRLDFNTEEGAEGGTLCLGRSMDLMVTERYLG